MPSQYDLVVSENKQQVVPMGGSGVADPTPGGSIRGGLLVT